MSESAELPALRAALARAIRQTRLHPGDRERVAAARHLRERYAEARTVALIGQQLDSLPLSTASRHRIAVAAGLVDSHAVGVS